MITMTNHNFITAEKLRSWHTTLLRYTLAASGCPTNHPKVASGSVLKQQQKVYKQNMSIQNANNQSLLKSHLTPTYINHPLLWNRNKIILHASSSKLTANPAHYGSYGLVFACTSGQIPKVVKAKQSVASFKLAKGSLIGLQAYIRGRKMDQFHYKWSFLAPSANGAANVRCHNNGYGLTNIFILPELDLLDYYAFEPLSGFDLVFD